MGYRLYVENGYGEQFCFGKNFGYTETEKEWKFLRFLIHHHYWECLDYMTDNEKEMTEDELYKLMVDAPAYAYGIEFIMTWKEFSVFIAHLSSDMIDNENVIPYWMTTKKREFEKFMSCSHDFHLEWW